MNVNYFFIVKYNMEKKTITISPDLFSTSGKRRISKKKTKRIKPRPLIKPNIMQKELLKRIKEHADKEKEEKKDNKQEQIITGSEFEKHLDYLTQLSNEKKKE